jgi:hypothetical protein
MTCGLLACVAAPQVPQVPLQPAVRLIDQKPPVNEARRHHLRQLLANAQQALAEDHLMYPETDNAYQWYRRVLALDERNAEAHWGMQQITARYLQLAEQAFVSMHYEKAELMLQRAQQIAATPAQAEALRQRYQQQPAANAVLLSESELSSRSTKLQSELVTLAVQAQAENSRLLIVARSDSEGRWIYQQMSSAVAGYRLRGNIEIGHLPRVVLIDL